MSEDLNVLVISENYNTFLKESVDAVSKFVNLQEVFIHHNYLSELSPYLPSFKFVENAKRFRKEKIINLNDKPKNLNLHVISMMYLKPDGSNKMLGEKIFKKIDKYIEKNDIEFDMIHSYFLWHSGFVGAKLKKKYQKPLISTGHGFDVYDVPFRDEEFKEKTLFALSHSDHITTVTEDMKKILTEDLDVPFEKVSVIPNGVDVTKFYPRDKEKTRNILKLPQDKMIILSVGNLVQVKGHTFLIEAINKLVKGKKYENILCVIVGSGKLKQQLENQTKKLGLENYVKLVGQKPHSEIPLWMNAADLFVLPSISESFGIVQIESLACGRPVVATKNGGSENIIKSDDVGFLCEPKNSVILSKYLEKALKKEWKQKDIINYFNQYFHSWDDFGKQMVDLYGKVMKKSKENTN